MVFRVILAMGILIAVPMSADDSSRNLAELGRNAESQGYLNLAAHYYAHALKQASSSADLEFAYARVLQKSGHLSLAEAAWQRVLEIRPGDAVAAAQLAVLRDPVKRQALEESLAAPAAIDPGPKSDIPLAKGEGAWVEGDPRVSSKAINAYNLAAPRQQRIKYVFQPSATVSFKDGHVSLGWDGAKALILADSLAGEGRVYALISGSSQGSESVTKADWEALAQNISAKIAADDRYSGLIFEISPEVPALHNLFALVKKGTDKPLGVALTAWDKQDFHYTDFVVLRSQQAVSAARDQVNAFLNDARSEGGRALVGFSSGEDDFGTWRGALASAVQDDDPAYLGIAIPGSSGPKIFGLLQAPLEHP
jgi:tetratricopeptide (TPR) repeat protein